MKKIYLAGGISDIDRKMGQVRVANKLEELGYEVYAAARNDSINDKSNDPTPLDIYDADIDEIKKSDIFVVRISGGNEDGTLSEIGMVAGWNEMIDKKFESIANVGFTIEGKLRDSGIYNESKKLFDNIISELMDLYNDSDFKTIPIVAYTTNERLMQPQFWNGIASGGFNHLIAGMIDKWGVFVGGEEDLYEYLKEV